MPNAVPLVPPHLADYFRYAPMDCTDVHHRFYLFLDYRDETSPGHPAKSFSHTWTITDRERAHYRGSYEQLCEQRKTDAAEKFLREIELLLKADGHRLIESGTGRIVKIIADV